MRIIKFSGRELAVMRALDFSSGSPGSELLERTHMAASEMVEVLHGLMDAGYVETNPQAESFPAAALEKTVFEVNPGYFQDLKTAIRRS